MAFHKKKEWLTVDDIATEMGVSRSYVISNIKNGHLKAFHPERIYRIRRDWYEAWSGGESDD